MLAVTAAVVGGPGRPAEGPDASAGEETAYEELLTAAPVAALEGEGLSPDGRFQVRTVGASDIYVSGLRAPERLQVVDTATGGVLWQDAGYIRQSVLWSPESKYVALAYGGRTWDAVTIVETETWKCWDVTLPDENAIPEYTFLPEDWGKWLDGDSLLLTVGQGGDGGEQRTYYCAVRMENERFTGNAWEQTTEVLPGDYDFDHDGIPETVELVTILEDPAGPPDRAAWYQLRVKQAGGTLLWSEGAHWSHPSWVSIFACEIDGQDYLLRYLPTVYQGFATYRYKVFSLDAAGQEVLLREGGVDFDANFGSPLHQGFVPEEITDFLWDLRGCLADSRLLISTENGEFHADGEITAAELPAPFCEILALDSREAMLDALRQSEAGRKSRLFSRFHQPVFHQRPPDALTVFIRWPAQGQAQVSGLPAQQVQRRLHRDGVHLAEHSVAEVL